MLVMLSSKNLNLQQLRNKHQTLQKLKSDGRYSKSYKYEFEIAHFTGYSLLNANLYY